MFLKNRFDNFSLYFQYFQQHYKFVVAKFVAQQSDIKITIPRNLRSQISHILGIKDSYSNKNFRIDIQGVLSDVNNSDVLNEYQFSQFKRLINRYENISEYQDLLEMFQVARTLLEDFLFEFIRNQLDSEFQIKKNKPLESCLNYLQNPAGLLNMERNHLQYSSYLGKSLQKMLNPASHLKPFNEFPYFSRMGDDFFQILRILILTLDDFLSDRT